MGGDSTAVTERTKSPKSQSSSNAPAENLTDPLMSQSRGALHDPLAAAQVVQGASRRVGDLRESVSQAGEAYQRKNWFAKLFQRYDHAGAASSLQGLQKRLAGDAGLLEKGLGQSSSTETWVLDKAMGDVSSTADALQGKVEKAHVKRLAGIAGAIASREANDLPEPEAPTPDVEAPSPAEAPKGGFAPIPVTDEAPTPGERQPASGQRLKAASKAAGIVGKTVAEAGEAWAKRPRSTPPKLSFIDKLLGKKAPPPAPLEPSYDHAGASSDLAGLSRKLDQGAQRLESGTAQKPTAEMTAAKVQVDITASTIQPKVEPEHANTVFSIGVGIESGDQAMLEQASQSRMPSEHFTEPAKIGQGGSDSTPFKANFLGMAPVVFKLSKQALAPEDPDAPVDQVTEEAKAHKAVGKHKNVLPIYGEGTRKGINDQQSPLFAMALAERGTLKDTFARMRDTSVLDEGEKDLITRYLLRGTLAGLAHAHAKGIKHSDIKDENVFMSKDFTPKVADWGLASSTDTKIGTAPNMAPEVVTGPATKKSDIWSVGEMLLIGRYGRTSVDVHKDRKETPEDAKFGIEGQKKDLEGDAWLDKLAKLPEFEGKGDLVELVRGMFAFDPKERISAKDALKTKYLKDVDEKAAKAALAKLYGERVPA